MEAAPFSCPRLPMKQLSTNNTRQRKFERVSVRARRQSNGGRDFGGRLVDENMIVLRMRIKEMTFLESDQALPSHWMDWEKKYFMQYNEGVCEAMGILQLFLMNTRPSLAFSLVALVAVCVPIWTFIVVSHVLDMAMRLLSGIYLS